MGMTEDINGLRRSDRDFLWHPFTQMKDWMKEDSLIIEEGRDCFVRDVSGRWYLDGVSSIWVNIHGHRKEELDRAIREQLDRIAHTTLLGAANIPSIRLAEALVRLMQGSFGSSGPCKVFYSDNGSTAVEVALKMAFQYWAHKGAGGRHGFIGLEHAYHGDTVGAMSVGGVDLFHSAFGPLLFKTHRAPSPYCYRCGLAKGPEDCGMPCLDRMDSILSEHSAGVAAVIVEPLVQAAGGMIISPEGYLKGVRELCTKHDVLLIADEVATGFGRTGAMFACEREGVVPDIICLSKGITGGYMPLAATIATQEIYDAFLGEFGQLKTFFHGHSYTGHPLACACATACLDVFEKEQTIRNLRPKIEVLEKWIRDISAHPHVGEAKNAGLMGRVELVRDKAAREPYDWEEKMGWKVAYAAREAGVLIRPLGNVVVIMPPLAISLENLRMMLDVIGDGIEKATGK
jgi:adenosylmethionine-8-amino-7-oxononanoate aminotransferase